MSRPELICRSVVGSGKWEVVLSADEDCALSAVHLEGKHLEHTNNECSVPSLKGGLTVSCQVGQELTVPLFDNTPLIFKLRKHWNGQGRRTAAITNGHFIVIAPDSWERTGHVPVKPDGCADPAFRAHYFYRDTLNSSEDIGGFRECNLFSGAQSVNLEGQEVFDDSEDGTLFVGAAPVLNSPPGIAWARVGEEAEHGWRGENFEPAIQSLRDVLNGRNGHFFLRVYDSQARLLDSMEFRHIHNLKQISVNGKRYTEHTALVPLASGHPASQVRFVGANGATIAPVSNSGASFTTSESGAMDIPPHPDADRIRCSLNSDAGSVNIALDLPRIWWRLDCNDAAPGDWRDKPLVMTRQEFREHARANATMTLLSKRFASVRAGFDQELDQQCSRTIDDDCIEVPLARFVDYAQIGQRLYTDAQFNIEWGGEIVPLVVVTADPIPEIVSFTAEPATIFVGQEAILEWNIRNAVDAHVAIEPGAGLVASDGARTVRPTKSTRYTLTLAVSGEYEIAKTVTVAVDSPSEPGAPRAARVMSSTGKWRSGKGFSTSELHDAGLTPGEAVGRSIAIDRRRRTSHRVNVEAIRSVLNA